MSAFRMYVRVVSTILTPAEITDRLGVTPDEAHAMGSRRRPEMPPRPHTTWVRNADVPEPKARPEDLGPVLLQWGDQFASALGKLTEDGRTEVSLAIVQEVRDIESRDEKGIFLSPELIT
jgi:hypothetical protein